MTRLVAAIAPVALRGADDARRAIDADGECQHHHRIGAGVLRPDEQKRRKSIERHAERRGATALIAQHRCAEDGASRSVHDRRGGAERQDTGRIEAERLQQHEIEGECPALRRSAIRSRQSSDRANWVNASSIQTCRASRLASRTRSAATKPARRRTDVEPKMRDETGRMPVMQPRLRSAAPSADRRRSAGAGFRLPQRFPILYGWFNVELSKSRSEDAPDGHQESP